MPRRFAPEHGDAPMQTGVYRRAAAEALNSSGQEVRRLLGVVPLRRQVVEADAVVERQLLAGAPVVLQVELEVRVPPLGNRELVGLRVGVEHAQRRVGVAVPGVERVVGVVGEVDAAVEAREDALRLVAVLVVDAGLGVVRAEQLGDVGEHVVGDVLVGERATVGLVLAGVGRPAAAELEPRHVVALHGVGEQVRQPAGARVGAPQRVELQVVVEGVVGATPAHLHRGRVVDHAGGRQHVVGTGMDELHRRRQLVAAIAGPGRAVRLQDLLLRVHVPARHAPVVGDLVVHAEQVLTTRRAVSRPGS